MDDLTKALRFTEKEPKSWDGEIKQHCGWNDIQSKQNFDLFVGKNEDKYFTHTNRMRKDGIKERVWSPSSPGRKHLEEHSSRNQWFDKKGITTAIIGFLLGLLSGWILRGG